MKKIDILFGLVLLVMFLTTGLLNAQFAGGSGVEEDPYLIGTAAHLNNVRNYMEAYFLQIDDIDLTGYDWEPIGVLPTPEGDQPFYGTYNGNNYLIENFDLIPEIYSISRVTHWVVSTGCFRQQISRFTAIACWDNSLFRRT